MTTRLDRFIEKIVREDNFYFGAAGIWGFCLFTYLLAGRSPIYEPRFLPFMPGEGDIPTIPWTVWIYISEYPLLFFSFVSLPNLEAMRKYAKAILILNFVAVAAFLIFPTCFPRENFSIPIDVHPFTLWVFQMIKVLDAPTNCLPSLHVAFCMLSSLAHQPYHRGRYLFFLFWTALIIGSTLTMKQHYVVDGITGVMLATVVWLGVFKRPILKAQ